MNTINQPQTNGKIRLDYIDALRGIAALMVLICHSLQVDPSLVLPPALVQTFESGKYGVQLFFVISALTIFYSLFNGDPNTINFLIRRFFRIAPLYFVAVAFYSWLFGAGADGIGLNLAFLHGFSPRYINSVVPGGWSIGIEMVFYCMIPFLFRKLFNLKRALYFFLATVVFSFICMYVYRKLFTSTSDLESFVYFWLPNHLPVFALGFITYYLSFEKTLPNIKSLFSPLVLLCLVVSAGILTKLSLVGEHVVFAITAAVFIFLLSKKALPGLVNKTTLYLGKISYSLYLTQYAAIAILIKTGCFSLFPGNSSTTAFPNLLLNLVFLFIITVLLSTILYYGIEQPFQTLGKKLLRHRTKLNSPAALRATVKRMPS
ncbi:MAG TPA: acyltransferase, partial [Flavisolibacter sp.]|nr:acyltransferase [Flavisolibacter sp.]